MKIQINVGISGPHWVETAWESATPLRQVVADEPRALAARRVNAFCEVVETCNYSHAQIREIDADMRAAR